jgi:hypothetical protein
MPNFLIDYADKWVQDLLRCLGVALPNFQWEDEHKRNPRGEQTDEAATAAVLKQRRLRELLRKIEQLSWRTYLKGKSRVDG